MILSDVAIRNRTTVGVLIVVIVAFGVYSYVTLPREASPDVPIPYIVVTTSYEGVSPEDIESSVTIKIEKEMAGLKGLKEMSSTSAEGDSVIVLEFLPEVSTDDAMQYVRDKLDLAKSELPDDVEEPTIQEISFADFPIVMISLTGDISPVRLKAIADELEDVLESIPGVLNCDVLGGLEREIRLEIDQDQIAAYGLTIPEIIGLIPAENVNISAGGLETPGTKFNVRVPAEFVEPDEVDHLVIAVRDGRPIYLTDVATVRDTFKDRIGFSRLDGAESITVTVQKRVGADIIPIADGVKLVLEEFGKQAPQGTQFEITLDQSKDIHLMIADLENNMLSGLILVAVILLIFLGWRASLIVACAIPMSMLLSVTVLGLLGYTLNMIVLFSLIMALGMLVDNAIVIVENIYRHFQQGGNRFQAALTGTAEVAWPVITSTATTVAAFAPLIFWPGIMGGFMKYLPITLIITLISSLFVAMIISPTISSAFVSGRIKLSQAESWFVDGYRRLLQIAVSHRFTTLTLVVLLLVGLGTLYGKKGHGVELFPDFDPRRAVINIRCPQGTNIYETDRLARLVERRLEPFADDLEHVVTNVGSYGTGRGGGGDHQANITLAFYDYELRKRPSADAVQEIRAALADIPGAEIKVDKEEEGPPTGGAVTARIIGEDFEVLAEISERAKRTIANVPGLVNLRSDHEATRPELAFRVDRQRAMLLGANTAVVGNFLKTAVFGREVGTYRQFNDEYDITVRLPVSQRRNIEDLFRLRVPTARGNAVPLSSLGDFSYTGGFGTIRRIDQKRVITLTADAEGRLSTAVLADAQQRLDPLGVKTFGLGDFHNLAAFCRELASGAAPDTPTAAGRVWQRLDRGFWATLKAWFGYGARALVKRAAGGGALSDEEQQQVAAALNATLGDRALYDEDAFSGTRLTDEAQRYLDREPQNLSAEELRRFNRVLLECAFPTHIERGARLELPPGYEIRYAGEKEEQDKAQAFLSKAFVIALFLIVLILVSQFNTLRVPFIIMTSVILSLIGVFAGLLICEMPFGIIMTGVGVISLAGVVVNNAIVLLDYTRLLQRRGLGLIEAAIQAGITRLRPVLLTAATTILGLIPMAIGVSYDFHKMEWATKSESSQWWASMAIAVIFGLAFATLLTLVVLPTLYVTLTRAFRRSTEYDAVDAPGPGTSPAS